jgi:tripartite-type tricarboxylate transporter receptor subunit TctC
VVALPAASRVASAQSYPVRPARVLSGFPPGGISDTYARLIAKWLSQQLGQQFIVENRPGAGGNLAAEAVAKSAADGYTLLQTTSADAWNATLYQSLSFNIVRNFFSAVATISRGSGLLVVNPSLPVQSVPELIAYAKNNPGKVTVASAGIGSAPHMFWELFRTKTGVDMVHVPYRGGGPAVVDLLGGQVQVYFGTFPSTIEQVRAGKLRALAVTSPARAAVLPDVPAMAEFLPGFEASIYVGIAAPRDTPGAIVDTLGSTIGRALDDPGITRRIAEFGDVPLRLSPAAFSKLVADETEKWAQVIRAGHITAE